MTTDEKIQELANCMQESIDKCLEFAINAPTREKRKYWTGAANAYGNVLSAMEREFDITLEERRL